MLLLLLSNHFIPKLLFPPRHLRRICQLLIDVGVVLALEQRQQLMTYLVASVLHIAIAGVFTPLLPEHSQVRLDFFAPHPQHRPDNLHTRHPERTPVFGVSRGTLRWILLVIPSEARDLLFWMLNAKC